MKGFKAYVASLIDPEFIPSGIKTAMLVGSLLFVINHGPALYRRQMTQERWISVILTYVMPYLVNVYGQYSYRRRLTNGAPSLINVYPPSCSTQLQPTLPRSDMPTVKGQQP
ncbi:nitrate/nitrite transporter NrtS [Pantanalinema rosaneae CENA516]|uniref:nitrate/nitrite transporter NrtS n=1 Tax=Pantanalinema rosaneae TaxID=1620701 RepID=UPI003D6FB33D